MFRDLREFITALESKGELVRVKAEVDADQEITIIQHRVLAAGGPALLFEQVKGSPYRLVSNLYGTPERVRMVFGRDPQEIGEDNLVIARDDGKGIYGTGHNWVIQVPGKVNGTLSTTASITPRASPWAIPPATTAKCASTK